MRKAIIIAILSAGLALTGANALAHDEEHYFAMGYLAGSTLGQHSLHRDASDYRHRDYRSRLYRPARIPRHRYRHWHGKQHRRAAYRRDHDRHTYDGRYRDRHTDCRTVQPGRHGH
ncbi:MAG: hypothetical protein JSW21_03865 [Gammaproteobacteria bacterium]|nr:MAG: hypothetical protein JSW21_03865 [Gammaproteobacteria bacterium]